MTTNTTTEESWSKPYALLPDDLIASGSTAMAVCLDLSSPYLVGIHLYYGAFLHAGKSYGRPLKIN